MPAPPWMESGTRISHRIVITLCATDPLLASGRVGMAGWEKGYR
jgi:hypothetical protein